MTTLALHRDPVVVSAAKAALAGLAAACRTVRAASVLTDDGFTIARIPQAGSGERLASMASTLQALTDAVVRELRIGTTDHVQLVASEGAVVVRRVGDRPCAMVAVFDEPPGVEELADLEAASARLAVTWAPAR
ncbi:roadblock/LC7 domain-containing protein [Protaetiibacter sp. SSC-01]|uniref:roadblock/LC7 domain-containing protein n=1 Tax=Protaetiibacter sp. SSC-01 TaxID=2759943 RepID=UPI001656F37D|nr:roadblock/LC7 domain-containing protein [Protaetiibacter sp. SSC-01]QNO38336.1 roadblock/LC7 domain-containing protein [Protaetiibacter sp. SSC-01]